jgi:hypothetical protein
VLGSKKLENSDLEKPFSQNKRNKEQGQNAHSVRIIIKASD